MTRTHRQRLQKLADYLRTLPAEQWDFRNMYLPCGCAMAHTIKVFPDLIHATGENLNWPSVVGSECDTLTSIAHELFGLNEDNAYRLFNFKHRLVCDTAVLPPSATANDVADEIEKLLREQKKGKK